MNATLIAPEKPHDFWRVGLFVFVAVLLLSVPQAALLPLLDRDEPRFAEASREMLQSGDIIVPTFNHAPRYAKPPLIYWCQVISFRLFGENAFAARLPSLLATAGTAVLLCWWGAQLGKVQVGLGAALSYAFCFQTIQQGRVATADALLIFFMTLTALAGWKLLELIESGPTPSNANSWNFWGTILAIGFGGGFLAKGPEVLLPFVPLIIMARHSGWRVIASFVAILLLGLLLVSAWAIPAYMETHGDYWRVGMSEGVGQRMISGLQGHGASSIPGYLLGLPLYLVLFWLSALTWSPLLVIHRKRLFSSWKPDAFEAYLLLNIGLIFLVFSLMVTKLPHYTLPAFPFIALLFARRWIVAGLNPKLPIKLSAGFGIGFALFAIVFVPVAIANHATPSPVGELVREAWAEGILKSEAEFAMVDFQEPNVIWEMRRVVSGYGEPIGKSQVLSFLGETGPRAVVLSTELWEQIDLQRIPSDYSVAVYKARGFNAAKGSFIDLTLVVRNSAK